MTRINRARVADIVTLASGLTGISECHIYGRVRRKEFVRARNAVIWVARQQRPQFSYPDLGRMLGGRDHSTIVHGFDQAEYYRGRDAGFRALTDAIREFAATMPAFIKERTAVELASLPKTVALPPRPAPAPKPRAVKAKNDFGPGDGQGDAGHSFAAAIASGSNAFTAALTTELIERARRKSA